VVRRGKTDNIAFASDGLCAKQPAGKGVLFAVRVVFFLIFLDRAVVVYEDKCPLELWILLAVCPRISWT
jgi:hypothetical protein